MADTPTSPSDQTAGVAALLRNADRMVKEKQYEAALQAIAQARQLDPRNLYALAYEERVRSLLKLHKERKTDGGAAAAPADASVSQMFGSSLDRLSSLAQAEAQRSRPSASSYGPVDEEKKRQQEESRRAAIEAKIESFLKRAEEYCGRHDYHRALDEISRAHLLDPTSARVQAMRSETEKAMVEWERKMQDEERRRRAEDEVRKEELRRQEIERLERERQERQSKEEQARRRAQQDKVRQYLERTRGFLAERRFEAAVNELAFVFVIEPTNSEALALQQAIVEQQEEMRREEEERRRKKEEEAHKRRVAVEMAIQKHIEQALKLATEEKFSDALRIITRAFVLDPVNVSLQQCEQRIIASQEDILRRTELQRRMREEEEERRKEEELKQIEQAERERLVSNETAAAEARRKAIKEQIQQHLTGARRERDAGNYNNALAEIALAFLIDPFDEEVKRLEEEIIRAQEESRLRNEQQGATPVVTDEESEDERTRQQVEAHLAQAERFRAEGTYERALDELANAFLLDPLDERIPVLEQQVEAERVGATGGTAPERVAPVAPPPPPAPPAPAPSKKAKKAEAPPAENKVQGHLQKAQALFTNKQYEEALAEIALGLTVDPSNAGLQNLEHEIWRAQNEGGNDAQSSLSAEEREEHERLIQIHLLAAEEFQKQEDFTRALDEVAKAYLIDPLHPDIKAAETRIRQNELRHNNGAPLKLVYKNERAAGGSR